MTKDEARLVKKLGFIWDEYLKLPEQDKTENHEFMHAIHRCQTIILARTGQRQLNSEKQNQREWKRH